MNKKKNKEILPIEEIEQDFDDSLYDDHFNIPDDYEDGTEDYDNSSEYLSHFE